MVFHLPKKVFKTPVPKINNIIITKVDDFNFLGLMLDTQLNWKNTLKIYQSKSTLNILKLMLYNTLLVQHINYCLITRRFQCQRINQLQKRAIRIITLSNLNSHTDPLFKQIKLTKSAFKNKKCIINLYIINYIHTYNHGR